MPTVSVVIPFLDAERTLAEAVDSVLAQTFRDWELLLVDDGSSDRGCALAAAYVARDSRVMLFRRPHRGAFAARMTGAKQARAKLVALLDADDVWDPRYLDAQLRFRATLRRRDVTLTYGPARYWHPKTPSRDFVHTMPAKRRAVFPPGALPLNFLSTGYASAPCTSASLIKRTALLDLATLAPVARKWPLFEDQFLVWELALRGGVACHDRVLVRYRQKYLIGNRPASLVRRWRLQETGFLKAMRRRLPPGHPAQAAITERLTGRDYFFRRIPPSLRR